MKNFTFFVGIGLLSLIFSACTVPGAVTGGGWIPSADGVAGDKANFGFSAQQCDVSQPATGNFNYHDKTSKFSAPDSVKMNGTIANAGRCVASQACSVDSDCTASAGGTCELVCIPGGCPGTFCSYPGEGESGGCDICKSISANTYGFDVAYTSTNSANPGTGTALVCVVDNGQGSKASSPDFAMIAVVDGPYAGYRNQGNVQGNISAQTCP